uniref:Coilin p80 n=1 Tax=Mastacembelus armatus TaxID=205130 RepID=A0A3Q3KLB9_9TELE
MAANSCIRVRLHFDYPPPAAADCRSCWLLVDLNACRVVADLESIIRDRFEFSRGSILHLFVEDCYLPHTESIYVVRDNDSVRVKVHCVVEVNGHSSFPDTSSKNCRKRQRLTDEDGPVENGVNVQPKEKQRKKGKEESLEEDDRKDSGDERKKKSQRKHTKKKKKKRMKTEENSSATTPKPTASPHKIPSSVNQPVKSTKKPPATQAKTQDSSSDSSSSVKITPKNKPSTSMPFKGKTKDSLKFQHAPSVLQSTICTQKQAVSVAVPPHDKAVEPCSSDTEEEIELVVRGPTQQPQPGVGSQSSWRGNSHAKNRRDGPGDRRRGDGKGAIRGHNESFEFSFDGVKEPSYHTDLLTNTSVIVQNEAESPPRQDYSSMPLLAAPPQVGQKIAFKLLELTENYTPEISEYKVRPGKFDLVYQNPDGSERVEYAVSRGVWVSLNLQIWGIIHNE